LEQVTRIINDRRLGRTLANEFVAAVSWSKRAGADLFQNLGDSLRESGSRTDAAKAYARAMQDYVEYAASLLPDSWTAAAGATADGLEIAKAYKAAADSTTKLAEITRNEAAYKEATSLAAAAVYHAPNGALKASSWAALGSASQATGDLAIAASAFRAAVEQGSTALWTKDARSYSAARLGNRQHADLSTEYLAQQADEVSKFRDNLLMRLQL
jgi:hypothetical protein